MRRGTVKVAWELGKISHANLVPKVFPRWQTQRGHLKFRVNLDRPFLLSQDVTCRDETARVIRHKWGRIESSYRFCEYGELSFTIYLSGHSFSIENSGKFKNKNRSTTFMRNNLNTAMYFGIAHVHRAWDWPDQVSDDTRTELKAFSSCLLPPCVKTSLRAKLFIIPLLVYFHTNPTLFPKKNSF